MTSTFPPETRHESQVEDLLAVFGSVVEGRRALYVSSPLTTGRRLSEWYLRNGGALDESHPAFEEQFRQSVVEPNRDEARAFVAELRRTNGRPVIDPTGLVDISGWTQDDYRFFWGRVIERYVQTVIFLDGWSYSSGCSYEFLVAVESEAETVRQDLSPLTMAEGRSLISEAIKECRERDLPTAFLDHVHVALGRTKARGMHIP